MSSKGSKITFNYQYTEANHERSTHNCLTSNRQFSMVSRGRPGSNFTEIHLIS